VYSPRAGSAGNVFEHLFNRSSIVRLLKRPKIALILPLAVLAVASLIALNEIGYQRSADAALSMAREQEKRGLLHTLLQQVLDAETGQRGYLITGDEKYLEPYADATTKINLTLDSLRGAYAGDPAQLARFAELSRGISKKLAELEVTLKIRRLGGDSESWMQVVRTNLGKDYMLAIRDNALSMIETASKSMQMTQLQIDRSLSVSRIGVTLAALLGLLAFHLYLRQTEKLNSAAETQRRALALERDGLEQQVRDRTTRLTVLANHLQTVQEKEREHLARELHDELGALLTAAKLDVARIRSKLPGDNEMLAQRCLHLTETLNAGIALKRRIIEDLRPSSLSNLGLQAALEILVREFGERSGIAVNTDVDAVDLDPDAQLTVYRIVQESLTNISKYARAKEVTVTLHAYEHHIEVDVVDNGQGFDVDTRLSASHGFAGMRHRVEALRGTLHVSSAEGQGTTVRAVLPKATLAPLEPKVISLPV
jgi:signal transduction histidine kinase